MQINSQRFGVVDLQDDAVLSFPSGIIGFPREQAFALIPHQGSDYLAWLQSMSNPELAFPVVSAHFYGDSYPDVSVVDAAHARGIAGALDEFAILAVLCAPKGQPATVNLMAPIVVNSTTRQGAQVILEGSRFSTREVFVAPQASPGAEREAAAEPVAIQAAG
ncbi:MAG: flagellar assembly protein FliW [Pseudomonadota bacterium]